MVNDYDRMSNIIQTLNESADPEGVKDKLEESTNDTTPSGTAALEDEKVNESVKMRDFSKNDWYVYSGTERFSDGSNPKVWNTKSADIILGAGGGADSKGIILSIHEEDNFYMTGVKDIKAGITLGNQLAKIIDNEFVDLKKVAKKFKLTKY